MGDLCISVKKLNSMVRLMQNSFSTPPLVFGDFKLMTIFFWEGDCFGPKEQKSCLGSGNQSTYGTCGISLAEWKAECLAQNNCIAIGYHSNLPSGCTWNCSLYTQCSNPTANPSSFWNYYPRLVSDEGKMCLL